MTAASPQHLLHVFSTFSAGGGPQVRSCEVFNHFGTKYTHTIIAIDDNFGAKTGLSNDLLVDFVPLDIDKRQRFGNLALFRKTLTKIRPDLLVTYCWGAIDWVIANYWFPVCPHIHLEEGFNADEILTQKQRRILLRRIFLPHTFRVVVPSLTLQELALKIWKLKTEQVEYIPNGIDCHVFAPAATAPPPNEKVIIGTVAGLRKVKNIPRLISAFSQLPRDNSSQLWIIGDGPEYESLLHLVADLGLSENVRLFGHVDDPSSLLKKMSIFATSSDTEQMPTSVLEAMASGLPVLGTDVGDINQMVATQNKEFIVDKNDENRFFYCLQRLIHNPELRKRIGQANRQKCVDSYSRDVMFQNYRRLFESAMILAR
jgi:L-malate glycosyltransferase